MSQALFAGHVRRSVGVANTFFRWWLSELSGLIPDRVRRLSAQRRGEFTIDLCPDGIVCGITRGKQYQQLLRVADDSPDTQQKAILKVLKEHSRIPASIVVRLRPDQVLQKTLAVPLAAYSELRQVIKFDLGRQIPLVPDEVYFDFRILEKQTDAQRLLVELMAVPRATVQQALAMACGWGITVDRIGLADQGEELGPYNFLPRDHIGKRMPPVRRAAVGVFVLAGLLCCAVLAEQLHHDQQRLNALAAQIAATKPVADRVFQLKKEIQQIAAQHRFLPDKRQAPQPLDVLDELTRVLPDNTWIFELNINGADLRAEGYSPAASSLISLLDSSSLFANARFGSPVTQGTKPGIERFEVSCDIRRAR